MLTGRLGDLPIDTSVLTDTTAAAQNFAQGTGIPFDQVNQVSGLATDLQQKIANIGTEAQNALNAQMTPQAWQAKQAAVLQGLESLSKGNGVPWSAVVAATSIGVSMAFTPVAGAAVGLIGEALVWLGQNSGVIVDQINGFLHGAFGWGPSGVSRPDGQVCSGWYDPVHSGAGAGDYVASAQPPYGPCDEGWKKLPFNSKAYVIWLPTAMLSLKNSNGPMKNAVWVDGWDPPWTGDSAQKAIGSLPAWGPRFPGWSPVGPTRQEQVPNCTNTSDPLSPPTFTITTNAPIKNTSWIWPYTVDGFAPFRVMPGDENFVDYTTTDAFNYYRLYTLKVGMDSMGQSIGFEGRPRLALGGDMGVLYRNIPFLWRAVSDVYVFGKSSPYIFGDFLEFFVQGMLRNAELEYNCQAHMDARQLLASLAFTWNHLHESDPSKDITFKPTPVGRLDTNTGECVIHQILSGRGDTSVGQNPGTLGRDLPPLTIHYGRLKTELGQGIGTPTSTAAKAAIVAGSAAAVGAVAVYAYAGAKGVSFMTAAKSLWKVILKNPIPAYETFRVRQGTEIHLERSGTAVVFSRGRARFRFRPLKWQREAIRAGQAFDVRSDQVMGTFKT